MKRLQKKLCVGLIFLLSLLMTSCGKDSDKELSTAEGTIADDLHKASREVFAMDTYMTLTGYGKNSEEALDAAVQEIQRLEALFSIGYETSEIAILNRDGKAVVSTDTETVLKQALELYDSTNGTFEVSIYPLMELWGFTTDSWAVPLKAEIQATLEYVDASKIQYDVDTHTVILGENQGIDLGGIAKGYTSDRVMQIFEEYDLVSGVISLGGNVQCYADKIDGSPWRCGIQDPDDKTSVLGVVSVKDKAVITSGGYERYFVDEETGKEWHHILDPSTGYSAQSGLVSVTIVSEQGMLADGLSTALFIMGLDKASDYWRDNRALFDMILVAEDGQIYVTEGIEDSVSFDVSFEVIR